MSNKINLPPDVLSSTDSVQALDQRVLDSIVENHVQVLEVKNILGTVKKLPIELIAINNLVLLLIMIFSITTLIHKLNEDMNLKDEFLCKVKYVGLFIGASLGLVYPFVWGFLGLNILILLWLIVERLSELEAFKNFYKKLLSKIV